MKREDVYKRQEGVALSLPLTYGTYRVEESKVPEHYVDQGFAVEVEIRENGKTYEIAAENEPTKGYIRITKTDRLNGNPIAGVRFDIYENDAYGSAPVSYTHLGGRGLRRYRGGSMLEGNAPLVVFRSVPFHPQALPQHAGSGQRQSGGKQPQAQAAKIARP